MRALAPLAALLAFSAPVAAAPAYDAVRQEQACPREREPRPLRQTVVVLDEAMVSGSAEANQLWKRIVVEAADAREVGNGTLGPRERLTLLVARRDGSEVVPLFVGCSPNLPAEEAARARGADSAMDRFLGNDSESRQKKSRDVFAGGLARALAQVAARAEALAGTPAPPDAFLRALRNAGRLADPNHGLPRLVLVSPFQVAPKPAPATAQAAREQGFALAERSGLDLGRAEVYLAGAGLGEGAALEFARALLLGAKGWLVAARSDGMPRPSPAPTALRVYAGFIDYVDQRVPLQLRVAATPQGDLVNSWIETSFAARSAATPLNGKMLCRGESCEVRGDGRFAQVWIAETQGEPADRGKLPFAGARNIALTLQGDAARGRISDPLVLFGSVRGGGREELRFEIQRADDSQF